VSPSGVARRCSGGVAIGNESVPKIIINNTGILFFKTANCIFYQTDMERDMYIV